jgi:hypothetical protein
MMMTLRKEAQVNHWHKGAEGVDLQQTREQNKIEFELAV